MAIFHDSPQMSLSLLVCGCAKNVSILATVTVKKLQSKLAHRRPETDDKERCPWADSFFYLRR